MSTRTDPGTTWKPKQTTWGSLFCSECGQSYIRHGGPEDDAKRFGVSLSHRHLLCPATQEEWDRYWQLRRRESVEVFTETLKIDLARFSEEDRAKILGGVK